MESIKHKMEGLIKEKDEAMEKAVKQENDKKDLANKSKDVSVAIR